VVYGVGGVVVWQGRGEERRGLVLLRNSLDRLCQTFHNTDACISPKLASEEICDIGPSFKMGFNFDGFGNLIAWEIQHIDEWFLTWGLRALALDKWVSPIMWDFFLGRKGSTIKEE